MAIAHLICGKTGSGKTTLAKGLEESGAVRFSIDEWMIQLYGREMSREVFDARLIACRTLILNVVAQLTSQGVSTVLDCGFWKRVERDEARSLLVDAGAEVRLHFLDVPDSELRRRLVIRNKRLDPDTFEVTAEMFEMFQGWFEPPAHSEQAVRPDW